MSEVIKKNKERVISARYTEDEYMDILLKISDGEGKQIISPGAFSKAATLSGRVTVVDKEVEQYKVFVASKISNNVNQISKRLNSDFKAKIISEKTYGDVLEELNKLTIQVHSLLEPLR